MIVTFCGHREIFDKIEIRERLIKCLENLIIRGADTFLLGGYGGFDDLAAACVRELKVKYPYIQSVLVIPYPDRKYDMDRYDTSVYPPLEAVPRRFAIIKRNQWMVDKSDVAVAYITHDWGGAAATFNYASKRQKHIINIVDKEYIPMI